MDAFASARVVALARSLLALSRASATGVLVIANHAQLCRVALVEGAARAMTTTAASPLLGDWLLQRGELDVAAHHAALGSGAAHGPVGAWLADLGVATRCAIERALQDQLRARMLEALRWRNAHYRFSRGASEIGVPHVSDAVDVRGLVLSALQREVDLPRFAAWLAQRTQQYLGLSPLGRALLPSCATVSTNDELLRLLERGAGVSQLTRACAGAEADLRLLATLCSLSALAPVAARDGSYSFLLRKRRQLRSQASAAELLEVRRDARADEVRRALRRLSKHAHPDVLGPLAPNAIRETSGELMRALLRAEAELCRQPARTRARSGVRH